MPTVIDQVEMLPQPQPGAGDPAATLASAQPGAADTALLAQALAQAEARAEQLTRDARARAARVELF